MKIKKTITISFIALLVIALPLILIQVSKQQEIRQRASGLDDFVKFQTSINPASVSSPNQQVSFSIDLINAPLPKNIAGIDMQITYDSNSLAFYNFYPQALTNAKLAQSRQAGSLHYLWIDPAKISDSSQKINLGSIVFLAKQEGLGKDIKPMISISNITVTALGEQNVLKGSLPDGSFEIGLKASSSTPVSSLISLAPTDITLPTSALIQPTARPTIKPTSAPTQKPQPTQTIKLTPATKPTLPPLHNTPTPTPASCPRKTQGDANCDNKINLRDFVIWKDERDGKLLTKTADFYPDENNVIIDKKDFDIWEQFYKDQSIPH